MAMMIHDGWLIILGVVFAYVNWVFVIAWKSKRLDFVDIAWGGAFVIASCTSLLLGSRGWLQYLATTLVVVWGLRLSFYILKRVRRSAEEDPRYSDMRKVWKGNKAINAYFRIFIVQGALVLIVSSSVLLVNFSQQTSVNVLAIIGSIIWLAGFIFESVGDAQLRRHLSDSANKGKIMITGLWRYTRHPNYFGEAVQWWGIFMIALSVPYGWISVISPVIITSLLLFVSGVPLTEKRFEGRPGWREYKAHTSMFIPLPPKS